MCSNPPGPVPPQPYSLLSLLCPPSPPFLTYPHFPSVPHYFYPTSFAKDFMLSGSLFVSTFPLLFLCLFILFFPLVLCLCHS